MVSIITAEVYWLVHVEDSPRGLEQTTNTYIGSFNLPNQPPPLSLLNWRPTEESGIFITESYLCKDLYKTLCTLSTCVSKRTKSLKKNRVSALAILLSLVNPH